MHDDFSHALREAGLRVTRPRLAVLEAVRSNPHADAGAVIAAVRGGDAPVSHQAVYDCLHALTESGIVRRIQPAGHTAHYEIRAGDDHHHLVCRSCGKVVDAHGVGAAPRLAPSERHGFDSVEAEVIFWGDCPGCRSDAS